MAVKKRDVVLMGKTAAGDQTIDMPITRLGNIEDSAEIKEKPALGDYIPILDMADGGQMKKFPYVPAESSGSGESGRYYEKNVTLSVASGVLTDFLIELNIRSIIGEITVNNVKLKTAAGRIRITRFYVSSTYKKSGDGLNSSESGANNQHTVPLVWKLQSGEVMTLLLNFSDVTDEEIPFKIGGSEIYKSSGTAITARDGSNAYKWSFPFFLI